MRHLISMTRLLAAMVIILTGCGEAPLPDQAPHGDWRVSGTWTNASGDTVKIDDEGHIFNGANTGSYELDDITSTYPQHYMELSLGAVLGTGDTTIKHCNYFVLPAPDDLNINCFELDAQGNSIIHILTLQGR